MLRRACGGSGPQAHFESLKRTIFRIAVRSALLALFLPGSLAFTATLGVVGSDGLPVKSFRWQLEEDRTPLVVPTAALPAAPSFAFHPSAMALAASGRVSGGSGIASVTLDPAKRYFLTVFPDSGYTLGGRALTGAQTTATVTVAPLPLAPGQLSVFVYQDNAPLNGRPDPPVEPGLGGFAVRFYDAAGLVTRDASGNPLGTTYDSFGSILQTGQGFVLTAASGEVLIKNLPHGKYTVRVTPPEGEGWVQSSSRAGGTGAEAWVRPGEPAFNLQFGPPGYHAAFGFTKPVYDHAVLRGGVAVRGQVVDAAAAPLAGGWVALAEPGGRCAFAGPCDAAGKFKITNVPAGLYQLAAWDASQASLFTPRRITVAAGDLFLGTIPLASRFARLTLSTYSDANANAIQEPAEPGIDSVPVNLRFRDGSVYQTGLTAPSGGFSFGEVFPFASWLVAEAAPASGKLTSPPTRAFQAFAGARLSLDWGVANCPPGQTAGIHGQVAYAVTRAEDDPRNMKIEPWEPGIPRVPVFLYAADAAGAIADTNHDGRIELGAVSGGAVSLGDAIAYTTTDAWDDHPPAGAYDGWGAGSQVRPGVYDGAYRFTTSTLGGGGPLPPGTYIVQAVPPAGYEVVKEEDKNVGFGETYTVAPFALPPEPVGDPHLVPAQLSLFPGVACKFAGQSRPKADRKRIILGDGMRGQVDFELFTPVPLSGHLVGRLRDPLAAETDPASINLGGNHAPPWLPVSIQDASGREVERVYADAAGAFSALVPSTFSANAASPSGAAPAVYVALVNSPGSPDASSQFVADPYYDPRYAPASFTFSVMPGTTAYLDAPLERRAAFAGVETAPPDLDFPAGTPLIASVAGPLGGPYAAQAGQSLTLTAVGKIAVPNPFYTGGSLVQPRVVTRDYGFGAASGAVTLNGVPLKITKWSDAAITATVPAGAASGQLTVVRAGGQASPLGVTLTVGAGSSAVRLVRPATDPAAHPLQDAIDAAQPGDLLLLAPGRYRERVILWKPLRLQGAGASSTVLDTAIPPAAAQRWRERVGALVNNGAADLLPGQSLGLAGGDPAAPITEEGAGILVLARNAPPAQGGFGGAIRARIDGLTVTNATGGGIVINGYARGLEVANTILSANYGVYGGGLRAGHPTASTTVRGLAFADSQNTGLYIHHNLIRGNGAREGGGGITLYGGCGAYRVAFNTLLGNFTRGAGGGFAHDGLSPGGILTSNTLAFNQSLGSGGGISISGAPPTVAWLPGAGAGAVKVTGNLVQANQAGGEGGGLALSAISGQDVLTSPTTPRAWSAIDAANNVIVNNQAGLAAGGIALRDAARVNLIHNTIARNESTATSGEAFNPAAPGLASALPAGVVAFAHGAALRAALAPHADLPAVAPYAAFSNPALVNNIIWQNRSFTYDSDKGLLASSPPYVDLAVLGLPAATLNPQGCLLSSGGGDPAFASAYFNLAPGRLPVSGGGFLPVATPATGPGSERPLEVRFGPLTLTSPATGLSFADPHLGASSAALGLGLATRDLLPELALDFADRPRPSGAYDAGALEYYSAASPIPAPFAGPDTFSLRVGATLALPAPGVLANDAAASGGSFRAFLSASPRSGSLFFNADGSFTYSPRSGFNGIDTFTYRLGDGFGASAATTVTLRVLDTPPAPPPATDLAYATLPGHALNVPAAEGILARLAYATGDTIFARRAGTPGHGTAAVQPSGAFVYTPASGFAGNDAFSVQVVAGSASAVLSVRIIMTPPVNHRPAPSVMPILTTRDHPGQTRVLANDPDPGDTVTYTITLNGYYGTAAITPTGLVTYTPITAYTGQDQLMVKVADQAGAYAIVPVPVLVTAAPPAVGGVNLQFPRGSDNVFFSLGAGDGFIKMADGRLTYIFGYSSMAGVANDRIMRDGIVKAQAPGPLLAWAEGQQAVLNLTNLGLTMRPDCDGPQSLRLDGLPQAAPIFAGSEGGGPLPLPGATIAYVFGTLGPGTYPYHGHAAPAEQVQMGLGGLLYVIPKQDGQAFEYPAGSRRFYTQFAYNDGDGSTGYDVEFPLQIGALDPAFHDAELAGQAPPLAALRDRYPLLNGRGYPDTVTTGSLPALDESLGRASQPISSYIEAAHGQRILLRLACAGATRPFTLAATGLTMQVVGRNARLLRSAGGENQYLKTTSLTLGGGESCDVILDTLDVPPGTYFLYTTNLHYLSNNQEDFGGLMTEIRIK